MQICWNNHQNLLDKLFQTESVLVRHSLAYILFADLSLLRRTLATLFYIEPVLLKIAEDLLGIGTSANTFQLAPPDKSDEKQKNQMEDL